MYGITKCTNYGTFVVLLLICINNVHGRARNRRMIHMDDVDSEYYKRNYMTGTDDDCKSTIRDSARIAVVTEYSYYLESYIRNELRDGQEFLVKMLLNDSIDYDRVLGFSLMESQQDTMVGYRGETNDDPTGIWYSYTDTDTENLEVLCERNKNPKCNEVVVDYERFSKVQCGGFVHLWGGGIVTTAINLRHKAIVNQNWVIISVLVSVVVMVFFGLIATIFYLRQNKNRRRIINFIERRHNGVRGDSFLERLRRHGYY